MEFEQKIFKDNDRSRTRKEYESQLVWFLSFNSPFSLTTILYMSKKQRDTLLEWVLTQPKEQSHLFIEGCGSSQKEYDTINLHILEKLFQQDVTDTGAVHGKRRKKQIDQH